MTSWLRETNSLARSRWGFLARQSSPLKESARPLKPSIQFWSWKMMKKDSCLRAGISACAAILAACQFCLAPPASAAPAAPAVGSGAEWHNVNGDSDETGYSRLDKITPANAGKLGLAWYVDLPG